MAKFKINDRVNIRAIHEMTGKLYKWEDTIYTVIGVSKEDGGRVQVQQNTNTCIFDVLFKQARLIILRKPKMVRVKAWSCLSEISTIKDGHYGIMYGKKGLDRFPCTIHIKAGDYKKLRGKK